MDEEYRELERQAQTDPSNLELLQRLARAYERQGGYRGRSLEAWLSDLSRKEFSAVDDARQALAQIGLPAVVGLIGVLESNDPRASVAAAWTLGDIGPSAFAPVPTLIAVLRNGHTIERMTAAWTLGKVGSGVGATIPALVKATRDRNQSVCLTAVAALGELGPLAKIADPVLRELLKCADSEVQEGARLALEKIHQEPQGLVSV